MGISELVKHLDSTISDSFGRIRLLFVIRNDIGYQCLLPLIRRVLNDSAFIVSITCEQEGCFEFPSDEPGQAHPKSKYIPPSKASRKKWHYVFLTDHTRLYFQRHTTIVSTSHASTHGNMDASTDSATLDYWTTMALEPNISLVFLNAVSDYNLITRESNNTLIGKNRDCLITGFIKSETLCSLTLSHHRRYEIHKRYGLRNNRKVVVITSHWTKKSLLNNISLPDIQSLIHANPEISFIIMGHPLLWFNHDGSNKDNPLYESIDQLTTVYSNLVFIPSPKETSEITAIADYFILDYSSYFAEACMMNKPIILYHHKDFVFRVKSVGILYEEASISFSQPEALTEVFSATMNSPDKKADKRENIVDYFLFEPDDVVTYIVRSLKTMGKVSGPQSRTWKKLVAFCEQERLRHPL